MKRILVLVMLCLASPTFGADARGRFFSTGNTSCGTYVDEWANRDGNKRAHYAQTQAWVAGWITAYNQLIPDTVEIMGNSDLASVMLWIENFCRSNPLESLTVAMPAFVKVQYPNRKR